MFWLKTPTTAPTFPTVNERREELQLQHAGARSAARIANSPLANSPSSPFFHLQRLLSSPALLSTAALSAHYRRASSFTLEFTSAS